MFELEVDLLGGEPDGSGTKIILSVQTAVTSPYFTPRGSFEKMVAEIQARQTFVAVCLLCEKTARQNIRELSVGWRATSNIITHLNKHHSAEVARESRDYLESKREEFQRRQPTQKSETRVQNTKKT